MKKSVCIAFAAGFTIGLFSSELHAQVNPVDQIRREASLNSPNREIRVKQMLQQQAQQQAEQNRQQQATLEKQRQQEHQKRKERQERLVQTTSKKWNDVTKTTVSTYLTTVRADLASTPLDDMYLKSIIDCANELANKEHQTSDPSAFAKDVVSYWQAKLEATKNVKQKTEIERYVKYSQKIEQKIVQKAKK